MAAVQPSAADAADQASFILAATAVDSEEVHLAAAVALVVLAAAASAVAVLAAVGDNYINR